MDYCLSIRKTWKKEKKLLLVYQHTVIVEGSILEIGNLEKWIESNLKETPDYIYYRKTNYDYSFTEYFLNDPQQALTLENIVTNIYTYYPSSTQASRTVGYQDEIFYDPEDINAIVIENKEAPHT